MVKLSVVIPVYNTELYIRKCLKSVLNQTYKDVEIVVVDDGSTDTSGTICDSIARDDKRVRVIHQENRGVIYARYIGLKNCSGQYVTFLDADDFVDEKSYEYALDAMMANIDAVLFNIASYYENRDRVVRHNGFPEGKYDKEKIEKIIFPKLIWDFERYDNSIVPSLGVIIAKKEIILKQYDKLMGNTFWFGEDLAIALPIYKYFNSLMIYDKCYYNYRRRNEKYPIYIKKDDYFDGLYKLYQYLLNQFDSDNSDFNWRKQIEYFFMYSVGLRKKIYNEYKSIKPNYFPFDRIEKGKSIALYGAGDVGHEYYKQVKNLNYCKSVLWVDKNYKNFSSEMICSPEMLLHSNIDYVVIAIEDQAICDIVKDDLITMGVSFQKIIY